MSNTKNPNALVPAKSKTAWATINEAIETKVDPMGMAMPLIQAQLAWLTHPQKMSESMSNLSNDMMELQWHTWRRALGLPSEDLIKPHLDDTRFSDPIWEDSASWDIAKEWYLLFTHHTQDMLYETPSMSSKDRRRAAFWWRKWLNTMAPTNFLWANPVALQKAFETNGKSILDGFKNFLGDIKAGTVRMTGPDDFTVGVNLATTPGKVVFRNHLLEVIHYTPTTEKVYETPIVFITPWINKFYVLDLTPKKSVVKFLVDQGFSVFITSWKNPPAEMGNTTYEDYLIDGVNEAVKVACSVSGSKKTHAIGYCIGGMALTCYAAWANKHYPAEKVPLASLTLFTTLVDYKRPGDIEVFLDETTYKFLAEKMDEKGYLDGKQMATAFRLLRSNSLIWHYVVHGYLYGETPPPFDILYWNMDTTRMPAEMHKYYLREFYLNNNLIKKEALEIAGEKLDLTRIVQPVYAVGAEDDHIAPWRSTFRINNFVTGPKRYVLSSAGHILGIINPIVNPPKREYRVSNTELHDTTESWHERAEHRVGSWWEDWMAWMKPLSGELVKSGPVATKQYPALADAPGTYVMER